MCPTCSDQIWCFGEGSGTLAQEGPAPAFLAQVSPGCQEGARVHGRGTMYANVCVRACAFGWVVHASEQVCLESLAIDRGFAATAPLYVSCH